MRYFSWDENKAKTNKRKHGVSFETARLVFDDPLAVRDFDQDVAGEIRWRTIGMVKGCLLVLAAHTTEEEDGDEYIRIISARPATSLETERYYKENGELGLLRG